MEVLGNHMYPFGSRSLFDPQSLHQNSVEHQRLAEDAAGKKRWKKWGPYVSDRQWGTCREDYGLDGNSWEYLPFELAHKVAYRWGEDGIAGICDIDQHLCLSVAMWNGRDPILKERFFGLTNPQGNHGEDVKDIYYHLDATPTHSYLKLLYKYPQTEFPYDELLKVNQDRTLFDPEFELMETGIFDDDRYFDVYCEYARASEEDILLSITAHNRGPEAAELHLLPQAFFRNTWSWKPECQKPTMKATSSDDIEIKHDALGKYHLYYEKDAEVLFCNNETNVPALEPGAGLSPFKAPINGKFSFEPRPRVVPDDEEAIDEQALDLLPSVATWKLPLPASPLSSPTSPPQQRQLYHASGKVGEGPYKDAFHEYIINKDRCAAETRSGTKAGIYTRHHLAAGGTATVRVRLSADALEDPFEDFELVLKERQQEADEFYQVVQYNVVNKDRLRIQRQALAGMIWTKQFYYFDMHTFFNGDKGCSEPSPERRSIRNGDWDHMYNADIILMPDKWEFPWYATWDLAFHSLPYALLDTEFAKEQLRLMTRDSYMHPNGQLPAYEWNFGDVNPPVHAWAAWRVYQMDSKQRGGEGDLPFLQEMLHKLMINFTWWVNRKDAEGRNIFQGGFLGLDNIGVFDRGGTLPTGGLLNQSDGTSWMAFYSLSLMRIAIELALHNEVYEDIASKFFEHFLYIARAMKKLTSSGVGLWDHEDEFYYDVLSLPSGDRVPIKVRSMVGLIPLFAVEVLEPTVLEKLPRFASRVQWLFDNRPDLAELVSHFHVPGHGERRLLSLLRGQRMKSLLRRMLDPEEFLSEHGIRAMSRYHLDHPYVFESDEKRYEVKYEPAEASMKIMGGNSNWRGPVWFPMNYLIIESLHKLHQYYGDTYLVEFPTNSGEKHSIRSIADNLSDRLISLFEQDEDGFRKSMKHYPKMADKYFRNNLFFYEHFNGDNGLGVGASHQTGWTGLVAKLIQLRASTIRGS